MGLTKSVRSTLVAWGCLTLGVGAAASACSSKSRDFASKAGGGTTMTTAGTTGDQGGSVGSGATGSAEGGMGASPGTGGRETSAGGTGTDGGSSVGSGEGGSGVGGSEDPVGPGPSLCDGETQVLDADQGFVDDFESAARFTAWFSFSDTVPQNEPELARVAGGAVSTGYSARVTATNINAQGYNAGLGVNLLDPALSSKCVDLSAFDGISFWARGSSPSNQIVFQLVVPASQPASIQPPGDCLQNCYGHPHRMLTISDGWQQFIIRFSDLQESASFDGRALMFNLITYDTSWDISIDEVAFYKGVPPVGPVDPN